MPNFKKAKSNNWLESDQFGDFDCMENHNDETMSKKTGRKRIRENNNDLKSTPTKSSSVPHLFSGDRTSQRTDISGPKSQVYGELWINKHHPETVEILAVNNKKVEEVSNWILESCSRGGVLILSGPAGAGKTATVSAVAKSFDICVKEWVNPIEQVNFNNEDIFLEDSNHYPRDAVGYVSKSKQFREWLRGVKYSAVSSNSAQNKVILIEDLPNIKLDDLHEIVGNFSSSKSRIPIVFIISESAKKNNSVKQLFPPQIIDKLKISNIVFNPVTTSNMVKTLSRIAVIESRNGCRKFQVPDKQTLENLAESVGGDLRAGINALEFACLNDNRDLKDAFESVSMTASSKSSKSTKKSDKKLVTNSELSKIGGKDQGLVMFHALGKILYAKREESMESEKLPKHLQPHSRKILKSNPEEVIEKSTLSADAFNCFLHQNYPPFYTKLDDATRLSEYFSISDLFMNEWTSGGKVSLTEYGGCVGARAVMFCNSTPNQNLGMRKMNKPEYYSTVRTVRQRQYDLQNIFFAQPNTELVTSSLPLISKIRPPSLSVQKMSTIREIGTFPGIKFINLKQSETISQDDFFDDSLDEALDAATKPTEDKVAEVIEDEDILIEDFDDD